jgi:hypothetical protein
MAHYFCLGQVILTVEESSTMHKNISLYHTVAGALKPLTSLSLMARISLIACFFLGGIQVSASNCTTVLVPAKIQAEDYCYMKGVETEITTDTERGQNVGWIDVGDWVTYNIQVPASGNYEVSYRVASENGASLQFEKAGGELVYGVVDIPATGGWQSWKTIKHTVQLSVGTQSIALYAPAGGWNVNWLEINVVRAESTAAIQAEEFSDMSGIKVENGNSIGYFDAGDWLYYPAINFGEISRSMSLNVAGSISGGLAELRLGSFSGDLIGTFRMNSTDGWYEFEDQKIPIEPTSGEHDLFIVGTAGQGIFNLDHFQVSQHEISEDVGLKVMSLNVYGWATMPQSAAKYAKLIESREVDVVGIQEGVNDWLIGAGMPTDYSRANALASALGNCWKQRYQIFVNTCRGNDFVSSRRFDMTDGPNATRTGESAVINKNGFEYLFITIHWEHQMSSARTANAYETADEVNAFANLPAVVVGDFNTGCKSGDVNIMINSAGMKLIGDAGIDCIVVRDLSGSSQQFNASPSDHPSLDAILSPQ